MNKALVLKSTGSWYDILAEDGKIYEGRLRGKLKLRGSKVTNPIAVGDVVRYEIEQNEPTQAIIIDVEPRRNYIIRRSPHKMSHGHIIAANIDQAVLIATLVFPKTSLGFIDRFLVAAESFRIPATLVFNKKDLLDKDLLDYYESLKAIYEPLGYSCLLISAESGEGIEKINELLQGKKSLISGHSGVGKSTLLNSLAPDLNLRTAEVSTFAEKGVHTTTFAEMFRIEKDTFVIDTPGIKELGLMDIETDEISHFFPEMRDLLGECKFYNCTHTHEPGCAVVEAVEQGEIAGSRFYSYLSMREDEDNRR